MSGAVEIMGGVLMESGTGSKIHASSLNALDELVLRVRGGEIGAFDELMAQTEGRALGLAWRILGDRDWARDACQEAFLRAYKSINSYRIGESFPAWVITITANVCRDFLKKGIIMEHPLSDSQILEAMPAPNGDSTEDAVLKRQHRELIQKALATLTPAERQALVLRDMEGLSTKEAAEALGLRAGTVRTQISTARSKVKTFCQRILSKPDRPKGGSA